MGRRTGCAASYDGSAVIKVVTIENNIYKGENQMEQKIKDALDQIRPFLQRDGGDLEFVEYTDENIVRVRLKGHCAGCPGAQMTIKGVVEKILKESYPEVKAVEAVL